MSQDQGQIELPIAKDPPNFPVQKVCFAEWLNGPYSSERAALLTAYLMGVATMQRLIKVDALVDKDLDIVVSFVAAALETCINGQPSVLTGKQ